MYLRVFGLFAAVLVAAATGYGQAVATPAVPLVGQPITISSLHSNGTNCGFYFDLSGQGLPSSDGSSYYQAGGGDVSYTFSGTYFPGLYYATADPGSDSSCLLGGVEPLTFAVVDPSVSAVVALKGQYTFLCRGELPDGGRGKSMDAAIGSFTADGTGRITAGLVDANSTAGRLMKQPLTGSYTLDTTGAGELTLKTPRTTTQYTLRTAPLGAVTKATQAVFIAEKTNEAIDSCTLSLQTGIDVNYIVPAIYGAYLLDLGGETAESPRVPIYGEQMLALNGDNTADSTGRIFSVPEPGLRDATSTGNFSITDAVTGRTTLTLAVAGEPATTPTHFVAYPVDPQHLFVMSLDSHATSDLLTSR